MICATCLLVKLQGIYKRFDPPLRYDGIATKSKRFLRHPQAFREGIKKGGITIAGYAPSLTDPCCLLLGGWCRVVHYLNQLMLCSGDPHIDEVLFLSLLPILASRFGWHELRTIQQEHSVPFQTLGAMDA